MIEPAYPFTEMHTHGVPYTQWKGMTLRDYFAAKAMQAIVSRGIVSDVPLEKYTENAYKMADAMMRAREA